MKSFEDFIREGKVFVREPRKALAKALIDSGFDRLDHTKKQGLTASNARYIVEDSYESLKELAEAKLALQGYKSYSHEAAIIFLKRFEIITPYELRIMDELRKKRNGIKYYGKSASIDDAKMSLEFAKKFIIKLKLILDEQLGESDG